MWGHPHKFLAVGLAFLEIESRALVAYYAFPALVLLAV